MDGNVKCRIERADTLEPLFPLLEGYGKVWLVCDRNVWGGVGSRIAARLGADCTGVSPAPDSDGDRFSDAERTWSSWESRSGSSGGGRLLGVSMLDASEEGKTLSTVEHVAGEMLDAGADRSVLVLGVGGGITTDIAGFAASIYKRGVRFAFVPTTLLAQVDAAIGGKNGVNFHSYKNMLGVIRQPEFTFVCGEVLAGLPDRALLAGVSEMLKTFIIADADAYRAAVELLGQGLEKGRDGIGTLSARAAEIKAAIVESDPCEHGIRRVLNLGHTFAHAVEHLTGGQWTHGDAVAVGTVMAAGLAERLDGKVRDMDGEVFTCGRGLSELIAHDFRAVGLPTECPCRPEDMAEAMGKDKKADGDGVIFILPSRIGAVKQVKLTPEAAIAHLRA